MSAPPITQDAVLARIIAKPGQRFSALLEFFGGIGNASERGRALDRTLQGLRKARKTQVKRGGYWYAVETKTALTAIEEADRNLAAAEAEGRTERDAGERLLLILGWVKLAREALHKTAAR